MTDFKALIDTITKAVNGFEKVIPGIQKGMLEEVLGLIKQLNVNNGRIKVTAGNIRLLDRIKSKLQKIILSPEYTRAVRDYVSAFDDVIKIQHSYFSAAERSFSPPRLTKELRNQAIKSVVNNLTETGLSANITDKIFDMLRTSVTSGSSYASLNEQLRDFIINSDGNDGHLLRYTRQITTDALNQFSGQYAQLISSDLGYEWYRYSGSNIETTRPWCLACRDRKWFHISEIPKVIKGEFDEFRTYNGKIYKKTGLPSGMIPGTDISNFMVNRGGYNCGHQWRPGSEDLVPQTIKDRVYASPDYQLWAKLNGKEPKGDVGNVTKKKDTTVKAVNETDASVSSVMEKAKRSAPEVTRLASEIADKYVGSISETSFKSESSIKRKVEDELGGDFGQLKDAVRNTVVVPYKELINIISELQKDSRFTRVKVQSGADYFGYRGIIANVKTKNGLIAEIQINTPGMVYAKMNKTEAIKLIGEETYRRIAETTGLPGGLGHDYYEKIRILKARETVGGITEVESSELINAIQSSFDYYSKFYNF